MTILGLPELYQTLASVGLKKGQIRALLPDWWEDGIATSESGAWEFAILVSRRLSLDATLLASGKIAPVGSVSHTAFKHRSNIDSSRYQAGAMIAAALAESVIAAMNRPFITPPTNTHALREWIFQNGNAAVDFESLLNFCWAHGIPVIPLPHLPIGIRKMDGAIFRVHDRPAIIISRRNDSKAWLSFILAHELGHFCLGHLDADSSIIDVDLKNSTTLSAEGHHDDDENQADQFALDILGGDLAEKIISEWSPRTSGVDIAVLARKNATQAHSSAGHLVLRHAYRTKRWPEAHIALNFLHEDVDAQTLLVHVLSNHLNLSLLGSDLQELVTSVTGVTSDV